MWAVINRRLLFLSFPLPSLDLSLPFSFAMEEESYDDLKLEGLSEEMPSDYFDEVGEFGADTNRGQEANKKRMMIIGGAALVVLLLLVISAVVAYIFVFSTAESMGTDSDVDVGCVDQICRSLDVSWSL